MVTTFLVRLFALQVAYASDFKIVNPLVGPPTDPSSTISNLYTVILDILFTVAGASAVLYLIWAGIRYITAGASPDKAKAARASIINAIIGIIIIVSAYFIISFAQSLGRYLGSGQAISFVQVVPLEWKS